MILLRMLGRDVSRNRVVMIVAAAFILLSSLLVAGGTRVIVELNRSIASLFTVARTPDFVQMHAGELDVTGIDTWAKANPLVADHQIVEMITVDGAQLWIADNDLPEENTVMDISIVRQNLRFDLLLDLDNGLFSLEPGEIAVPIYYLVRDDLNLGDAVTILGDGFHQTFTIAAFVRDSQMNQSIVHSKRFVVHAADFGPIRDHFGEIEYLVEFMLHDGASLKEFAETYRSAAMPQQGPAVDQQLFRTINALSDGIVAAVVIVLSLLLMVIAMLALRFIILASIEEDYREIGVMKAVGMTQRHIRRIYLTKYVVLGGASALAGFALSMPVGKILTANLTLYLGQAPFSVWQQLIPLMASSVIFTVIVLSCAVVLRRFKRISAVQALRAAGTADAPMKGNRLALNRRQIIGVNPFLGLRDVVQRTRLYALLAFVFFFAAFTILIPVHFLATIKSPSFVSYMGIGRSDIRIDLRQTDETASRFEEMRSYLATDPDVALFAPHVTSQFTIVHENGEEESIAVESGNFTTFPLDYLKGGPPLMDREIALSDLHARDLEKDLGDTIALLFQGNPVELTISGIYQDVTNGGRTAKALLPPNAENVLWYSVGLDLAEGVERTAKIEQYSRLFAPARVTELHTYMAQTLGETIGQLTMVTIVAVVVGLVVAILITALFFRMMATKDARGIAIRKSLGFSLRNIRTQYMVTALTVLGVGVVAGTIFSNTAGQRIVSALWSIMGAAKIRFVVDPIQAYVVLPLLLAAAVTLTTIFSMSGIRRISIAQNIAE